MSWWRSRRVLRLRKGLDLEIPGHAEATTTPTERPPSVGVLSSDYPGLALTPEVAVGQQVRIGETVFSDRHVPSIRIPAPAAGTVLAVRRNDPRGACVQIQVGPDRFVESHRLPPDAMREGGASLVTERLLATGDWCALRERPGGRVASPGRDPAGIFVRAMDSNPLAVDPERVLADRLDDFRCGLGALTYLTSGRVLVCSRPGSIAAVEDIDGVESWAFEGPHPAGLVGTHIHHLLPASPTRTVWYIGYQDVIAIGRAFSLGRPDPYRIVSIGGPGVDQPRVIRTLIGADAMALVPPPTTATPSRVLSGSVLGGRVVTTPTAFLGRYHEQLVALPEHAPDRSAGPAGPAGPAEGHRGSRSRTRAWTAELHGTPHPFFPLDVFERLVPLSLPVGALLRALAAGDVRGAVALGAMELEEEDLALCTYACPSKIDYGPRLRSVLDAYHGESA